MNNAYLNTNPKERIYFYAVEEFGKDWGKLVIVVRALYGLKGSRSAWTEDIRQVMIYLRFQPCTNDDDIWMISAVEPTTINSGDV